MIAGGTGVSCDLLHCISLVFLNIFDTGITPMLGYARYCRCTSCPSHFPTSTILSSPFPPSLSTHIKRDEWHDLMQLFCSEILHLAAFYYGERCRPTAVAKSASAVECTRIKDLLTHNRWLRNSSDFFCGSLLASLHKDEPLDVKVFYTRASEEPASNSLLHDDARALTSLSVSGLPLCIVMTCCVCDVVVNSKR